MDDFSTSALIGLFQLVANFHKNLFKFFSNFQF